ncbi:helicase-exonuclease AddAB subunit AddA [Leuconostoc pseudomesenteroides]|uniref:ATP-dependent helicase/nuclease subunit A n=3 Tax=Leuconostoc pseudomesenteroides TaxID=33968 RepID=A0ABT6HB26_LEUPS|nr:helicase-exonuclease AddAB subunit AddA [Leuconostoc pseudomesenteroides]MCC8440347.1 helicase-exonuclease AddAB subunit AddA [Leuconostoc pseudomesenteroides]MDG9733296.1 helicase-exonuclease AddAB subunit AddA [Leuconostoc pseudomesenteroides]NKZ36555.1 helicase-exonuclease AddAB subunit AddA [Leuconostoc pseudomesenteroides]QQB26897.1 helicase-exonuclease AddAB subunit AddA [Leuconostoc pseudomesenteroides]
MATTFTANQQRAIDETDHNILVAASAGSGKTTVLIERIIQKILAGTSVDNFLIVTFTNAAAHEMRQRLEIAIEKRLQTATGKQKRFLQEQLLLLPAANISTIDAYALRLIEMYYHVIGLDPQFRLLSDTAERELMRQDVLIEVFAEFYAEENDNHQDFLALVNNFGNPNHDDALQNIVLKLADFAEARADGTQWLENLRNPYRVSGEPLVKTDLFTKHIKPFLKANIADLTEKVQQIQLGVDGVDELQKTQDAFEEIATYLSSIVQQIETGSWDALQSAILAVPAAKMNTQTKAIKEDPDLSALVAAARQVRAQVIGSKSQLKPWLEDYFILNESAWLRVQGLAFQLIDTLVIVTESFRKSFEQAKRDAKLLDFPDLGTLALQILSDDVTKQTIQGQFQEILVDEYQDINQLQETLLTSVSNGHNMYMVGDVKQSIYGFRQAEPSLFTAKYKKFAQSGNNDSRIDLADNFRSQNNVTRVTNLIFTQLMDETLGDIAYVGDAKLVPKASYPEEVAPVFHLDIITQDNADETSEEDTFEKRQAQYALLANKILELRGTTIYDRKAEPAGMRPVAYGDIAILTRSKTGYIDLVATLRQAGIPVQVDGVGNYFQAMEIYLMLDILRVIDNPHQDIPLVAILRSPMFGFNENDLAAIRTADQKHDFWTAFNRYAKSNEQAENVIAMINKWHDIAIQNDLVTLIWSIYDETAWLDYVGGMAGGSQRQANLHALYTYAQSYQNNTHAGLFRFIRYIEQLQSSDGDLGEAPQEADAQAVRLMTIHASKGLEFPIVMLPEADKAFNTKDLNGGLLIQKNAGVGLEYLQPDALVTMPTLQKLVVKQALKRQSWSEEMRLLYVALTRAEQQLYIVGTVKIKGEEGNEAIKALWQSAKQTSGQFLSENLRLQANSYLQWLLISFARTENQVLNAWLGDDSLPRLMGNETPTNAKTSIVITPQTDIVAPNIVSESLPNEAEQQDDYTAEDYTQAKALLSYRYPNMSAAKTAAYQSVSEIKRLFEDPDRLNMSTLILDEQGNTQAANAYVSETLPLPTFLSDGQQKPSSSAIGTATHLLLQLIDITQPVDAKSVDNLLTKLVASEQILPSVAALIQVDDILRFVHTPFAQEIAAHQRTLQREATFAMIVPANQIYQEVNDDAPVLIHGIIDGYFVDESTKSVTLFDYKTDFVQPARLAEGLAQLEQRYKGQLNLYQEALRQEYPEYKINPPKLIALSVGEVVDVGNRN